MHQRDVLTAGLNSTQWTQGIGTGIHERNPGRVQSVGFGGIGGQTPRRMAFNERLCARIGSEHRISHAAHGATDELLAAGAIHRVHRDT